MADDTYHDTEIVSIDALTPHPDNYREHPDDQLEHIMQSIDDHGVYRNIVTARDGTILAGHGVWLACKKKGLQHVPIVRLDIDPFSPIAMKLLTGDNEISNLASLNDRKLSEILRRLKDDEEAGLKGTGFDEKMLANLVFITRPASEMRDHDAAAQWVGLPEYHHTEERFKLMIHFTTKEKRQEFIEKHSIALMTSGDNVACWTASYPPRQKDDYQAIRYE